MLTTDQISQNWDTISTIIETNFENSRKERLLEMFTNFKDRMCLAPASGKLHYHNCFTGGYIHHVLNVIDIAKKISTMWSDINIDFKDYTDDELIFVALNHDLGKIGDLTEDYYIPSDQDWKIRRGEMYDYNPKLQYMKVADRSLFLLQHYGIQISQKEYLGIYLHDGLYDDSNKPYLIAYNEGFQLKTSLPYIIHTADMMACQAENRTAKLQGPTLTTVKQLPRSRKPKNTTHKKLETIAAAADGNTVKNINSAFDDLFGGK